MARILVSEEVRSRSLPGSPRSLECHTRRKEVTATPQQKHCSRESWVGRKRFTRRLIFNHNCNLRTQSRREP